MHKKNMAAAVLSGLIFYAGVAAGDEPAALDNAAETATPAASAGDIEAMRQAIHELIRSLMTAQVLSEEKGAELLRNFESRLAGSELPPPAAVSDPGVVGVPYVPEFVKDEIRTQVRGDLRGDVTQDILAQARQERWGIPGAWPEWIENIRFKGDVRLRYQGDHFASENVENSYLDIMAVNEAGGRVDAGLDAFLNTTTDRDRLRARARIAMDAEPTTNVKVGVQLSTGNTRDPVSTNQTLGNTGNRYAAVFDQLYLRYTLIDPDGYNWLNLWGGRMPNPFFSTDLVWDSDLSFEGLAATYKKNLRGSDSLLDIVENDRTLFFTAGIFPLQEIERSSQDKWLYGAQLGGEWIMESQSEFRIALSYYVFDNIKGQRNAEDSNELDYTAPDYLQKGNVLYDISNSSTDLDAELFALAADYKEANLTLEYDYAGFAPVHVVFTGDYVVNVGYDEDAITDLTDGTVWRAQGSDIDFFEARTTGYQFKIAVGWPDVRQRGNWLVSAAYKRLERDAVLDAFTDSDFHLGGTDAKGWSLALDYGINYNVWAKLNLSSAESIDGQPFGVDVLQLDVNARF